MRLLSRLMDRSSPAELSRRQNAIAATGREALAALPGECCAEAWRAIDAGVPENPRHARRLPEAGAGLTALARYGDILVAARDIDGRAMKRAFQELLRHPRRLCRAVESYATETHSPHAAALAKQPLPMAREVCRTAGERMLTAFAARWVSTRAICTDAATGEVVVIGVAGRG